MPTAEVMRAGENKLGRRESKHKRRQARRDEALLAKFQEMIRLPDDVKMYFERLEPMRRYINETCQYYDDPDMVATNYLLRNQWALLANLNSNDPTCMIQPRRKIPFAPDPSLVMFGETMEIVCNYQAKRGHFEQVINGGLQDSLTDGLQVFKRVPQDDEDASLGSSPELCPSRLHGRYAALYKAWKRKDFTEDDLDYARMQELRDELAAVKLDELRLSLRESPARVLYSDGTETADEQDPRITQLLALEAMTSMPPPEDLAPRPKYRGWFLDTPELEDMRWDWTVRKPENLYQARFIAHGVWMFPTEIQAEFSLDDEDMDRLSQQLEHDDDVSVEWTMRDQSDIENPIDNAGRVRVWEFWHKETRTVYVFAEGFDRFLARWKPTTPTERWYPFYFYMPNRVTGRFLPVPDSQLQRKLQEEINELRTHDREARKASYPRFVVPANMLTPAEKAKLENALPFSVTEIRAAKDISESIKELAAVPYDPRKYDTTRARMEMEAMAGLPQTALGTMGAASTATEVAYGAQELNLQADRRRRQLDLTLTLLFEDMAHENLRVLDYEFVRRVAGHGAYWPQGDYSDQMWMDIHVKGSASGHPDHKAEIEKIGLVQNLALSLGVQLPGLEIIKELADKMEFRSALIGQIEKMAPGAMPGQGMPVQGIEHMDAGGAMAPPPGGGVPARQPGVKATPQLNAGNEGRFL